jgi:hypothetical protein
MLDLKLIELENWGELINHPNFLLLKKHLQERCERMAIEINQLAGEPSLDSSIKTMGKAMVKKELSSLLSFFDYKLNDLRLAKLKQAKSSQN